LLRRGEGGEVTSLLDSIESMILGVPTFRTQFGSYLKIIQDTINGFYLNPIHLEETAKKILDFDAKCLSYPNYWGEISQAGIEIFYSTYTWKIHVNKLLTGFANLWFLELYF